MPTDISLYKRLQDPQVRAHWRSLWLSLTCLRGDFWWHRHHQAKTSSHSLSWILHQKVSLCVYKRTRNIWHLVVYKIIPPVALLVWLPVAGLLCPAVVSSCSREGRAGAMPGKGGAGLPTCPQEHVVSGNRIGAKPRCQQAGYETTPAAKKQCAFPVPKAAHISPHTSGVPFLASATTMSVKLRTTQKRKKNHPKLKAAPALQPPRAPHPCQVTAQKPPLPFPPALKETGGWGGRDDNCSSNNIFRLTLFLMASSC